MSAELPFALDGKAAKERPQISQWAKDHLASLHPVDPERPFFISEPTLLSLSGGRTSGEMLRRVIEAHEGKLPDHLEVMFSNTGKEREKTLRFLHEIEARWPVKIHWLEWRPETPRDDDRIPTDPRGYDLVGYNSASRDGAPFEALIRRKQMLPTKVMRYCTHFLKVKIMHKHMADLGYEHYRNMIGLRADEGRRIVGQLARNEARKERFVSVMPLWTAGVTKADVRRSWLGKNSNPLRIIHPLPQGFDLGLLDHEGNCDQCFMKGQKKLRALMRADPEESKWWSAQEGKWFNKKGHGGDFTSRFSYAELQRAVDQQPWLFAEEDFADDDDEGDCGDACGTDDDLDDEL